MKGLLVKDLKLMMSGRGVYLGVVLVIAFLDVLGIVTDGGHSVDLGIKSAITAAIAVGTKSYDFYENGMSYLLTLPVSRREYVRESYLFAVLGGAVLTLIFGLTGIAAMALTGSEPGAYLVFLSDMLKSFGIILLLVALLIPFYLQFGVKRSSYIAVLVVLAIALGAVIVLFTALDSGVAIATAMQAGLKTLVKFPVILLVLAGSYIVSVIMMERKDF